MNVLFICSLNRIRSLTAEKIFEKYPKLHVRSAGTQSNARVQLNEQLLRWTDIIFVMEKEHAEKIQSRFPTSITGKRIICLDVGNEYSYMDPDLIEILQREVTPYLGY